MDYRNHNDNQSTHVPLFYFNTYSSKPSHEFSMEEANSSIDNLSFLPYVLPTISSNAFCPNDLNSHETKPFANLTRFNGIFAPYHHMNTLNQHYKEFGVVKSCQMSNPITMKNPSAHNPFSFCHAGLLGKNMQPDIYLYTTSPMDATMVTNGPPITTMDFTMSTSSGPLVTTTREVEGHRRMERTIVPKSHWTKEEDRLLNQSIKHYGTKNWTRISQLMNGKSGKQCRERWHNHLRPEIKKDLLSEEEERTMVNAHARMGNKWAQIAQLLPGRTENNLKNLWNAAKRRHLSSNNSRSKSIRLPTNNYSPLEEYMKTLPPEILNANSKQIPSSSSDNPPPFIGSDDQVSEEHDGSEEAPNVNSNAPNEDDIDRYKEMGSFLSL